VIAWPLVLVKIPRGNGKDGKKGSPRHRWLLLLSNAAQQRERDRLGLHGEENRLGQGRRTQRCLPTQILSSGTQRAKENAAEGMGETGGKRVADAMIEAVLHIFFPTGIFFVVNRQQKCLVMPTSQGRASLSSPGQ
jgi:hypothetical protein